MLRSWSGKGALLRQAGLLHLLQTPLYPRPLVGTCLEAGRRDPTHAQSSLLCGEQTAPLQIGTGSSPQARKVSGAPSGLHLSFTLSSGAQRPSCSPSPEALTPAPGPRLPQPAEEVGRAASGRQQLWSQETLLGFRGELVGWGPDGEGFPPKPFPPLAAIPLSCPVSGFQALGGGGGGCSRPASNPNPCSLQWPGEGPSASQQARRPLGGGGGSAGTRSTPTPTPPLHLIFPLG